MTNEVYSLVKLVLRDQPMEVDATSCTAYDIYNELLRAVKLTSNAGDIVSGEIAMAILEPFDYRSDDFQRDVAMFLEDMKCLAHLLPNCTDSLTLIVTAILVYCMNTDIKQKEVNMLINDICSENEIEAKPDIGSEVTLISNLLQNNVSGQERLEILSASQMMDVTSWFSNYFGTNQKDSPLRKNARRAENRMRTPKELGINVDKFLDVNRLMVEERKLPSLSDLEECIHSLQVDTKYIDLSKSDSEVSMWDIMNIRFLWFFRWIFQWILHTPSEENGKLILRTVIGCLLDTDKKFIDLGYNFLGLIEIALNALDAICTSKECDYYHYIRAKNIQYAAGENPDRFNQIHYKLREIQVSILQELRKFGFVPNSEPAQSVTEALISAISSDGMNGNCLEGSDITIGLCESISTIQSMQLGREFEAENVSDDGIKKLLGESLKLSTMLDLETIRMSSLFDMH